MRLWSLHPRYLDRMGLLAAWREGLLAQKVLKGETKGYRNHPQLSRFRAAAEPLTAIGMYLSCVAGEAAARGYCFDVAKIVVAGGRVAGAAMGSAAGTAKGGSVGRRRIPVSAGQVAYELALLKRKLTLRDPERIATLCDIDMPGLNDVFRTVSGGIEEWEKTIPEVLSDLN